MWQRYRGRSGDAAFATLKWRFQCYMCDARKFPDNDCACVCVCVCVYVLRCPSFPLFPLTERDRDRRLHTHARTGGTGKRRESSSVASLLSSLHSSEITITEIVHPIVDQRRENSSRDGDTTKPERRQKKVRSLRPTLRWQLSQTRQRRSVAH